MSIIFFYDDQSPFHIIATLCKISRYIQGGLIAFIFYYNWLEFVSMCNKSIFRCRVLGVLRFLNTCLLSPAWFKRSLSHPLVVKELSITLIVLYINGKAELYNVPSLNCHRKVSYPSFWSFSENRNETKAWEYLGVVRGNGRPWGWFPGSTSSYESAAVVIAHRMHNITTKSIEPPQHPNRGRSEV